MARLFDSDTNDKIPLLIDAAATAGTADAHFSGLKSTTSRAGKEGGLVRILTHLYEDDSRCGALGTPIRIVRLQSSADYAETAAATGETEEHTTALRTLYKILLKRAIEDFATVFHPALARTECQDSIRNLLHTLRTHLSAEDYQQGFQEYINANPYRSELNSLKDAIKTLDEADKPDADSLILRDADVRSTPPRTEHHRAVSPIGAAMQAADQTAAAAATTSPDSKL